MWCVAFVPTRSLKSGVYSTVAQRGQDTFQGLDDTMWLWLQYQTVWAWTRWFSSVIPGLAAAAEAHSLAGSTNSQTSSQIHWIRNWSWHLDFCVLTGSPDDYDTHWSLSTTSLEEHASQMLMWTHITWGSCHVRNLLLGVSCGTGFISNKLPVMWLLLIQITLRKVEQWCSTLTQPAGLRTTGLESERWWGENDKTDCWREGCKSHPFPQAG